MKTITIQQPEYFPWLVYFNKMFLVDEIVFLDDVQFKKRYFENRNKIRTNDGWMWISTPVLTKGRYKQKIMNVEIDNSQLWQKKIIKALMLNYQKSKFWYKYEKELCELIMRPYNKLIDFNFSIILFIMKKLNINNNYCFSSSLNIKSSGSQLILDICKKMNANIYLSGDKGVDYLNKNDFKKNHIKIVYHNFKHPEYKQLREPFISHMSFVDLLFNYGPDSLLILKNNMYEKS